MLNPLEKIRNALAKRGPLAQGIIKVATGIASAQLISFAAYPILTRFYTDEAFGALSVYSAVVGMVTTASSLQYEQLIPLPKSKKTARALLWLSLSLNAFTALLFLLIVISFPGLMTLFGREGNGRYLGLLAALGIALTGTYSALSLWAVRKRAYSTLSRTKITRALGKAAFNVTGAFISPTPVMLVGGDALGSGVGSWALARGLYRDRNKVTLKLRDIWDAAKEYWHYAATNSPGSIINSLANYIPAPLIVHFYTLGVGGQFGLATAVMGVPMQLIGQSVQSVFYGEASAIGADNPAKIKALLNKLTKKMALVMVVPVLALVLFSPQMFTFVFGDEWLQAGMFAQFLVLPRAANILAVPFTSIFFLFNRMKIFLLLNIFRLTMSAGAIVVPALLGISAMGTVVAYSSALVIYSIVFGVVARAIVYRACRDRARNE